LYDLGQTGLYDFYHGPAKKPFMDGRLEMPTLETFRTYVTIEEWLEHRDPRWRQALRELGDPVVILTHLQHFGGEAALINSPDWTCAYFDALAAVFVPRNISCAPVEFARRHFERPKAPPVPPVRGAAFRELRALYNLAIAGRPDPGTAWTLRMPLLLHALDRAAVAIREEPNRTGNWVLLGDCHRALAEILDREGDGGSDSLSPVWLARARFAYQQANRIDANDATARLSLNELERIYRRAMQGSSVQNQGVEQLIGNVGPDFQNAIMHLVQGRIGEARQALGRAVENSPRDGVSWYLLAWLAAEEGDGLATPKACRRALECDQPPGRRRVLGALEDLVSGAISSRHTTAASPGPPHAGGLPSQCPRANDGRERG
jgi:tetratricopeptide (TPR) repeat protein